MFHALIIGLISLAVFITAYRLHVLEVRVTHLENQVRTLINHLLDRQP